MSPRSLTSAPGGAQCCNSARSVNSRTGSLPSPNALPRGPCDGFIVRQQLEKPGAMGAGKHPSTLIELRFAINRGKKVHGLATVSDVPRKSIPPGFSA